MKINTQGVEDALCTELVNGWSSCQQEVRELMKIHIYANPNIDKFESAVAFGLKKDYQLQFGCDTRFNQEVRFQCSYHFDAKEHGLFGHEDEDFALNFEGPFFLECGFPVTRDILECYLKLPLHPSEHVYLLNYIQENFDTPKPLIKICRDVLRKHFRGQKIHKFMEVSQCPQKVKGFILMIYLLRPTDDTTKTNNE